MTTISINEKWRVVIDDMNHTLERYSEGGSVVKVGGNKGQPSKPSWVLHGYYPNLMQVLRAVVRAEATAIPDTDLNGYITRLESLNEEIKI